MIRFFNVSRRFPGGKVALDSVSFHIRARERVFLTGPSGAGKTTLLRLIYRAQAPSEGQILVNGRNVATLPRSKVPFLRRSIGVVFQSYRLIARKTVLDNVTYLPHILGVPPAQRLEQAREVLGHVGLAHRLEAYPRELSGGEQQRVALARALINRPSILLADEPTGNLDPELSVDILRHLLEVQRLGTTLLIATHDTSTIRAIGGRVLVLEDGRLVADQLLAAHDPGAHPAAPRPAGADPAGETESAGEAQPTAEFRDSEHSFDGRSSLEPAQPDHSLRGGR